MGKKNDEILRDLEFLGEMNFWVMGEITYVQVDFNPKNMCQIGSSPEVGVKIKTKLYTPEN